MHNRCMSNTNQLLLSCHRRLINCLLTLLLSAHIVAAHYCHQRLLFTRPLQQPKTMAQPTLHFVYGTLMAPEVLQVLIGRMPTLTPAVLQGYKRYQVPKQGGCDGQPCNEGCAAGMKLRFGFLERGHSVPRHIASNRWDSIIRRWHGH